MLLSEYLKMIYIHRIQKKIYKFVDSIVIYLEHKKVYKVIIRFDERHKTALRKHKINSNFRFLTNPPEEIIEDDLITNDNHERLTIIYNKKRDVSNVVVGEIYKTLANSK